MLMEKITWKFSFKLVWLLLLFITIIHYQPSTARLLDDNHDHDHDQSPPQHDQVSHSNPITFFMEDVLCNTHDDQYSPRPSSTTEVNGGQHPYPNPMGTHFSPNGANPLPKSNPTRQPFTSSVPGQYQTFDPSVIGLLSFPAIATLQGLELGTVTPINEQLIEGDPLLGMTSILFGKAKGVYVESSDDDEGHMMAMNVMVANGGFKDSLRFFGVHRTAAAAASASDHESHIAVIGGTGKFHGANGYATVKTVTVGFNDKENKGFGAGVKNKLLVFTVYLSH